MVKFHTVPIDYNGFGASFTPNSYFSRETWKRLLNIHEVHVLQVTPLPRIGTGGHRNFRYDYYRIPPSRARTSYGGLCVVDWCVETTAVSPKDRAG